MKRFVAFAAVFGVFAAGVAVGALGLRLITGPPWAAPAPALHPYDGRLLRNLDLSPEQGAVIRDILRRHRHRLEELRSGMEPRVRRMLQETEVQIEGVLTPEQRRLARRLRERQRSLRWDRRLRGRPDAAPRRPPDGRATPP